MVELLTNLKDLKSINNKCDDMDYNWINESIEEGIPEFLGMLWCHHEYESLTDLTDKTDSLTAIYGLTYYLSFLMNIIPNEIDKEQILNDIFHIIDENKNVEIDFDDD